MIFILWTIQNKLPKFETLEQIKARHQQSNNCQYYVAFTDDLDADVYFFENIPNVSYVFSENTEFASFVDDKIVHFRGDITQENVQQFALDYDITKCLNPIVNSTLITLFKKLPVILISNYTIEKQRRFAKQLDDQKQIAFANYLDFQQYVLPQDRVDEFNESYEYFLLLKVGKNITVKPFVYKTYDHLDKLILHQKIEEKIKQNSSEFEKITDIPPQTENKSYFYWQEYQKRVESGLAYTGNIEKEEEYVKIRNSIFIQEPEIHNFSPKKRKEFGKELHKKFGSNRQVQDEIVHNNDTRYEPKKEKEEQSDNILQIEDDLLDNVKQ